MPGRSIGFSIFLDAVDTRIKIIETISRISNSKNANELHILHPLVTECRWLFGPEYDSMEYTSNISLKNVMKQLFNKDIVTDTFINYKKRPDIVSLKDSTISAVAIDEIDDDSKLVVAKDILIIELKKGGFTIGRDEMAQASNYIEDIMNSGLIDGTPKIKAYVVGHKIQNKTNSKKTTENGNFKGEVYAVTYGQLTRTAEARLFKLKSKLSERYDKMQTPELLKEVFSEADVQHIEDFLDNN
jgi:hypothetical protein